MSKKLTPAQEFYVKEQLGKKTAEEIGKDLDVPAKLVHAFIKELPDEEQPTAEPRPDNPLPGTTFETRKGITAMTSSQSKADDDTAQKGVEKQERKHIHVIDPTKPVT